MHSCSHALMHSPRYASSMVGGVGSLSTAPLIAAAPRSAAEREAKAPAYTCQYRYVYSCAWMWVRDGHGMNWMSLERWVLDRVHRSEVSVREGQPCISSSSHQLRFQNTFYSKLTSERSDGRSGHSHNDWSLESSVHHLD